MPKLVRFAVLVFLCCAATAPLRAADNVATLRFSSLDAVFKDAERVSVATGQPQTRKELAQNFFGPLGLGDGAWIDGTRPIVISLPQTGLMNMGWAGALPVKETDAALTVLEARLGAPEVDGDLRAFVSPDGGTFHVRPVESYLVFGQAPAAVRGADLKQILDFGDLPPGNVALDLDLVPLTAMLQLGMAAGRQGVATSLQQDDSDEAGREAALGMYDLYTGLVNDTLLNASRLQLSIEVGSENLKFHKQLLPRADSTLAGLLKAQKSGFPDVARRLNVGSAVGVMATSIDFTEEFRTATREFALGYTEFAESLGRSMDDEQAEWYLALMGPWTKTVSKWIDCVRGDMAATYDFGMEIGFRVTQVAGVTDADGCTDLMDDVAKALAEMPEMPDGRSLAVVTERALLHSGVPATRIEIDMFQGETGADEETMEFVEQMFGGEAYTYFLGSKGDLLVSSAGAGAEQAFKDVIDSLSTRKKRGGMTPTHFEPLKAESGFFFALDATRFLREVAKLDPEDEDLQELGAVADQAGRWVLGTHLNPDALRVELSMPLSALALFAALDDDDDGHEHDDDSQHHDEESGKEASHLDDADHS